MFFCICVFFYFYFFFFFCAFVCIEYFLVGFFLFFNFSKAVVTESPKLDELTDDEFSESSLFGDNKGVGPSSSESSSKLSLQCKASGAVGLYGGVS